MNHSDKEMRIVTWKVICATISIFVSVLIYQAFADAIKGLTGPLSETGKMQLAFAHSLVWFVLLQLLLATVSGPQTYLFHPFSSFFQSFFHRFAWLLSCGGREPSHGHGRAQRQTSRTAPGS